MTKKPTQQVILDLLNKAFLWCAILWVKTKRAAGKEWKILQPELQKAWVKTQKITKEILVKTWTAIKNAFVKFPEGLGGLIIVAALLMGQVLYLLVLYKTDSMFMHLLQVVIGIILLVVAKKVDSHYGAIEETKKFTGNFWKKSFFLGWIMWMAGIYLHMYIPSPIGRTNWWAEFMCAAPVGGAIYAMPMVAMLWAIYVKVRELLK